MSDWFAFDRLGPRTWLVGEPGHVNCFLTEGDERAVLVDTGLGIADIRSAAESLTAKPILAVNTHGHSDHRGGNRRFEDVAAHPLASGALTAAVPQENLIGYLAVAREQWAAFQRARADDERFFHLFTATTRPRPLPENADSWTVPAGPAPKPLADGQRIDLGGRSLTVLHTPGHSPDSLCLLDERAGLLFAGDTLITGDFWAHMPDTEIGVFAVTLRRLADDLAGELHLGRVRPGHHPGHADLRLRRAGPGGLRYRFLRHGQLPLFGSGSTLASDGTWNYTWDPTGTLLVGAGVAGGSSSPGTIAYTDAHSDVVGGFTGSSQLSVVVS